MVSNESQSPSGNHSPSGTRTPASASRGGHASLVPSHAQEAIAKQVNGNANAGKKDRKPTDKGNYEGHSKKKVVDENIVEAAGSSASAPASTKHSGKANVTVADTAAEAGDFEMANSPARSLVDTNVDMTDASPEATTAAESKKTIFDFKDVMTRFGKLDTRNPEEKAAAATKATLIPSPRPASPTVGTIKTENLYAAFKYTEPQSKYPADVPDVVWKRYDGADRPSYRMTNKAKKQITFEPTRKRNSVIRITDDQGESFMYGSFGTDSFVRASFEPDTQFPCVDLTMSVPAHDDDNPVPGAYWKDSVTYRIFSNAIRDVGDTHGFHMTKDKNTRTFSEEDKLNNPGIAEMHHLSEAGELWETRIILASKDDIAKKVNDAPLGSADAHLDRPVWRGMTACQANECAAEPGRYAPGYEIAGRLHTAISIQIYQFSKDDYVSMHNSFITFFNAVMHTNIKYGMFWHYSLQKVQDTKCTSIYDPEFQWEKTLPPAWMLKEWEIGIDANNKMTSAIGTKWASFAPKVLCRPWSQFYNASLRGLQSSR